MTALPDIALSVRQPWAWAIVHGGKDVENRTARAITKGRMTPRRIAIHASSGMTRDEYEHARSFMESIGVTCPHPSQLVRGAIIGAGTVTGFAQKSESPWFFSPRALILADPEPCEPIPCAGELGYFRWKPRDETDPRLIEPTRWMMAWPGNGRSGKPVAPDNQAPLDL